MASERICIKCNVTMKPTMVEEVEVDCCDGCGGIWLDDGEIRQLAAKSEATISELCGTADAPEEATEEATEEAPSTVDAPCPACGGKLTLARLEPLSLERCSACHGIYLDSGELTRALAVIRGRGDKIATILALARSVATSGEIGD